MNSTSCERILVVDDSADMLTSMHDVLELEGKRVATATSCQAADAVLADGFDPDVIIIDVLLGGADHGEEYAREVRARRPAARIVLMSGAIHKLSRVDGDVDATLAKPFHVEQLLEVLSYLSSPRGARDSKQERPPAAASS